MMKAVKKLGSSWVFALFLCVSAISTASAQQPAEDRAPEPVLERSGEGAWDERAGAHRVRAELYALPQPERDTVTLGVLIEPDPHWHVYWSNSGESGLSTAITWTATYADGSTWSSEAMSWPVPEVFVTGGVVTTFGYDEVLHTVTMPLPAGELAAKPVDVTAHLNYLTCKVECIPGDQRLALRVLPAEPPLAEVEDLFARYALQVPAETMSASSSVEVSTRLSQSALRVGDEGVWRVAMLPCRMEEGERVCLDWEPELGAGEQHVFVPELVEGVKLEVKQVRFDDSSLGRVVIDVGWRVTATRPVTNPVKLAGVIRMRDDQKRARAFRVIDEHEMVGRDDQVKVFELEALTTGSEQSEEGESAIEDASQEAPTLLYALWLAFVGGLLLNIMPCVFPVLSIKVAGVARIAHHSRAKMLRHALAYTLGILSAMGAMALAVILMRQAGVEAGWGFQFQSPLFLLGLLGVLTLFAVNLFGAFDIGTPMGTQMQDVLNRGVQEEGGELRQSFLEGLMCVMLATPCSAPFMGTAVGFALTSHGVIVAAIFLMLGLGLALPFVALCALPGWAKLLPKPGPWLDVLKHGLAMCLLVTCVWLLWLLGQGQGVDGMAMGLLWMCGLAGIGGIYGLVQYRSGGAKWLTVLGLLVALVAGFAWCASQMQDAAARQQEQEGQAQGRWMPFDEEAIAQDVAQGKVVFVDFTADWCITCKVNENGVLKDQELLAYAERLDVVWVKADWTHRDDRIRAILKRHGKGGVPMYLIYGKNSPKDGLLLPELLTLDMIRDGLHSASGVEP